MYYFILYILIFTFKIYHDLYCYTSIHQLFVLHSILIKIIVLIHNALTILSSNVYINVYIFANSYGIYKFYLIKEVGINMVRPKADHVQYSKNFLPHSQWLFKSSYWSLGHCAICSHYYSLFYLWSLIFYFGIKNSFVFFLSKITCLPLRLFFCILLKISSNLYYSFCRQWFL